MEQTRQIKGIWIPIEVWENTDLSWNEKILLMEIDSFTKQGVDCFMSDEYIGKLLGVSSRAAARYMAKLIKLGYIERTRFDGRKRFVQSRLVINVNADMTKMSEQNCKKCHSNIDIDIDVYNKSNNTREYKERTPKFVKPTIEEIATYIDEQGYKLDAVHFYNYYQSNGWKVGKNPMKDWRAAVCTWAKRESETASPKQPQQPKESLAARNARAMANIMSHFSPEAQEYTKQFMYGNGTHDNE